MKITKNWQKAVIGVLILVLLVEAVVIVMNFYSGYASGDKYSAAPQSQYSEEQLFDATKQKEISRSLSDEEAKRVRLEMLQKINKEAEEDSNQDPKNEFYNTSFKISGSGVQVVPYHVWYQNGKMYAICYIVNMEQSRVENINVSKLSIYDNNHNLLAQDSFGNLENLELDPGKYANWEFIFEDSSLLKSIDLSKGMQFNADTNWNT